VEHLGEVEALRFIMETRSSGTFRGSCGIYFMKTTRKRERLGEVEASRFVKTTRRRGKYRRIWSFNILGLVTTKTVHVLASTLLCFVRFKIWTECFM
jgi:hypothetical protein